MLSRVHSGGRDHGVYNHGSCMSHVRFGYDPFGLFRGQKSRQKTDQEDGGRNPHPKHGCSLILFQFRIKKRSHITRQMLNFNVLIWLGLIIREQYVIDGRIINREWGSWSRPLIKRDNQAPRS